MPSFSKGERIDRALVRQGWVASRHRAQELVQAGQVWTTGTDGRALRIDKPSRRLEPGVRLHCGEPQSRNNTATVVSRGYLKLAHGLQFFGLSPRGAIALDIGAGTGGFSECLLHGGARRVYAGRCRTQSAPSGTAGARGTPRARGTRRPPLVPDAYPRAHRLARVRREFYFSHKSA